MDKDAEENVRDSLSLTNGDIVEVEIYRYEATGVGKREFKINRFL
jgi:hypothetical protein